jgi:hypothetical protein
LLCAFVEVSIPNRGWKGWGYRGKGENRRTFAIHTVQIAQCEIREGSLLKIQIENVIDSINEKRIRITDHADEECQADHLTFDEVYFSVFNGEIIENYADDKPYPSCLI